MLRDRITYRFAKNYPLTHLKDKIDKILTECQMEEFTSDINNILELYNIQQYIDNLSEDVGAETGEIEIYKMQLGKIKGVLGRYFATISGENFETKIISLDYDYVADFWSLMCYYKRIDKITADAFASYLENNPKHIADILSQKELVITFCERIFAHLLAYIASVGVIISYLLEKRNGGEKTLYIEGIFSTDQLRTLFEAYVNSDQPNTNMLKLLRISQNDKNIGLDDEIRLMAKRKEETIGEEFLKTANCFSYGAKVSFAEMEEVKSCIIDEEGPTLTYDKKWIQENLDYPTVLNNFIYLFEYTDLSFRSNFPNTQNKKFSFTDIFTVKGKKSYNVEFTYDMLRHVYSMQMIGYCGELQREGIAIENVIKWFFEEYLKNEFSVEGFVYNASTKGTSFLEKCKNIASEIESVLKQYRLYCKYGKIDRELLEMSSEHVVFSEFQSMQSRKYLYAKSEETKICMHLLFGDQILTCTKDEKYIEYDSLFDTLMNNADVRLDEFELEVQQESLKRLIDFGVVSVSDGILQLEKKKTAVLKSLYDKEVVCYNYCANHLDVIEEMIASGDLSEGKTLFSIPEQQYMNYILNKAEFSDGLDLRNKYSHGTSSNNESENYQHYIEFLKIIVLIMIKINEEFCLTNPEQNC